MTSWTPDELLKLDLKYAKEGVPHHQRPLKAALELLGTAFSIGVLGNPEVGKTMAAYAAIVPEVDTTWPGMGIGITASSDQVRKVTSPIMPGGGVSYRRSLGSQLIFFGETSTLQCLVPDLPQAGARISANVGSRLY